MQTSRHTMAIVLATTLVLLILVEPLLAVNWSIMNPGAARTYLTTDFVDGSGYVDAPSQTATYNFFYVNQTLIVIEESAQVYGDPFFGYYIWNTILWPPQNGWHPSAMNGGNRVADHWTNLTSLGTPSTEYTAKGPHLVVP